jgi:hypothetical protein
MTLATKYPLKFSADDLQALKAWLVHILADRHESAYYQLVQFTVGRIVVKIHKKDLGGGSQKLNLNAEQALALQILIATTDWPGDDLDRVLYYVQISLPPPSYRDTALAPAISWDVPLGLLESGGC